MQTRHVAGGIPLWRIFMILLAVIAIILLGANLVFGGVNKGNINPGTGLDDNGSGQSNCGPSASSDTVTLDCGPGQVTITINNNVSGCCSACSSQQPSSSAMPSTMPTSSGAPQGCAPASKGTRVPVFNKAWHPTEPGWIVLRAWSNQTDPNWPVTESGNEVVVLYGPDPSQRPDAYIGGAYWVFSNQDCAINDFLTQSSYQNLFINLSGMNIQAPSGSNLNIQTSLPSQLLPH